MKKQILILLSLLLFTWAPAQNWNQTAKIVANDRYIADGFGWYVSISGDYALVGAPFNDKDENGENAVISAGAAYFIKKDESGNWLQTQKIVASDRLQGAQFGYAVNINGNHAIVGAFRSSQLNLDGETVFYAGSAYIFEKDEEGFWIQTQKIVASDMTETAFFGFAVAIEDNTAIVGAYYDGEDTLAGNTLPLAGSAYIFERNLDGEWHQKQKIVAPDRFAGDMFGVAVDLSGETAIVGAWLENEDASGGEFMSEAGSAYLFRRDENGVWKHLQKIVASDRSPGDSFGVDVAIDGNYVIVGAFYEGDDNSVENAGAAYLFENTGVWTEMQKVVAPERNKWDEFGLAVSISGNHALVGARQANLISDTNTLMNAGAAYMFEKNNDGSWDLTQKLTASDGDEFDAFGISGAIDGNNAIIGASDENEDSNGENPLEDAGSVYIFQNGPLGFTEHGIAVRYTVYPNPTSGQSTIDLGKTYNHTELIIKNIFGQAVFQKEFENTSLLSFEINGPAGLYFAQIQIANNNSTTLKVLKE